MRSWRRDCGAATADHLEQTNDAEIAALAEAGVQPVLLPASVYALGKTRYPKARAMIEAGLGVVLATDFNPGSSPTPSIPMVLSLAATQMKMTPAEGVSATTINAAYSLGRGDKIGSLEAGKLANFTIFDCADYREIAYWFGLPQTHAVYIRGRARALNPVIPSRVDGQGPLNTVRASRVQGHEHCNCEVPLRAAPARDDERGSRQLKRGKTTLVCERLRAPVT